MKGLVALVTGGASGLGLGAVRRFVNEGAKVIIADLPKSKGNEISKELGDSTIFTPMDVTSTEQIKEGIDRIEKEFGKLDVVLNAAGTACAFKIYNKHTNEPHKLEDYVRILNVNTVGTFDVCRLSLPLICKKQPDEDGQRGVIINTASVAAFEGQMGQVAYSASKGAIVGMTVPMARDLSREGVRVCTIAPGLFDTPLLQALPEKVRTFLATTVPYPQRLGQPDEYAKLAQHIVENRYLNGEVIRLDAGLRMQM